MAIGLDTIKKLKDGIGFCARINIGKGLGREDLAQEIGIGQGGLDIGMVIIIRRHHPHPASFDGLQHLVEGRILPVIFPDLVHSTGIKNNDIGIPEQELFLIDKDMPGLADGIGDVVAVDPGQRRIACLGAGDPMLSPVADGLDIGPITLADAALPQILFQAIDKAHQGSCSLHST